MYCPYCHHKILTHPKYCPKCSYKLDYFNPFTDFQGADADLFSPDNVTLEELEIVPAYRKVIIENLNAEDYIEGPVIDTLNRLGELWVFGKDVRDREIYIKIALGMQGGQTICISFHIAEHPLKYPFKRGGAL